MQQIIYLYDNNKENIKNYQYIYNKLTKSKITFEKLIVKVMIIIQFMKRQDKIKGHQKNKTNLNKIPHHQTKLPSKSLPKETIAISKRQIKPLKKFIRNLNNVAQEQKKQKVVSSTLQEILQRVDKIKIISKTEHDEVWQNFVKAIKQNFILRGLNIQPITQIGHKILKQGKFIIKMSEIICTNPFISEQLVWAGMFDKYHKNIENNVEEFNNFFNERIKKTEIISRDENVKRSILKQSSVKRNVKFVEEQIEYTIQHSYSNKKKNKKAIGKQKNQFIIDYFQINDFYLVSQVQIVGIIDQIQQNYVITIFKLPNQPKEILSISLLKDQINHNINILKEIEIKYENLSYLDLQGKNINQIWFKDVVNQESSSKRQFRSKSTN